jgi:phosphoribosylaminoimidazole (AIR) synthetase
MEGDMQVDTGQLRIVSLKGRLIHDVKIAGGLLGNLNAGGTFDVERRQTGKSIWQITESHIHIQGHALIFKTISEQEDDVKTNFTQLPGETSLQQAEAKLLAAGGESTVARAAAQPSH